jgi:putative two-component system response regulator
MANFGDATWNAMALAGDAVVPPSISDAVERTEDDSPSAWSPESLESRLKSAKILIVDDEPINIRVVRRHLTLLGYDNFITTVSPEEVLSIVHRDRPDLVLLDIMMPGISGLDLLKMIREDIQLSPMAVIVLTAADDRDTMLKSHQLGATDFLTKPVDPLWLEPRVRNALIVKAHHDHLRNYAANLEKEVQERTAELAASRLEMIHCLGRAAEYRDNDTGKHIIRVGYYVRIMSEQLKLDPELAQLLELASPLHDIGKLGIPDSVLMKPGALDPDEFAVITRHCVLGKRTFEPIAHEDWRAVKEHTYVGEKILSIGKSAILEIASRIALTHHERWDGSGYPLGLSGKDIPIEGRITAVADVFDALSSERPYKPAFPLDECFKILEEGRGTHFDPEILDAFFARREDIVAIKIALADLAEPHMSAGL